MPHSRSAKKNLRKNQRRRVRQKAASSAMRTQVKKVRTAVEAKDAETAARELSQAQKMLDKAAKTRRIHPGRAARLKSRLAKAVQAAK